MEQIQTNLVAVQDRIAAACEAAGRDPASVRLLPVSKTVEPERIKMAYDAGCRTFGENKVQEAAEKAEHFSDLADIRWAVIGHLQTNKAKVVARFAHEFHALDSLKIAEMLDRRLQTEGRSLDVFVQVNSSGEDSKFGLPPDEVDDFATRLRDYETLQVKGLMTLAVFSEDREQVSACFDRMRTLQTRLRDLDRAAGTYDELSMGMSGDFELAVGYGATVVRVGTAIFGNRQIPEHYWPTRH